VGEPFGTGRDRIYFIGSDGAPKDSRGRQTLDSGAFLVAYVLFGVAAATLGLAMYSVWSSPVMDLVTDTAATAAAAAVP
jgi:hypothetical protein